MPSSADRLSDALRDRYRIERELGAGGMATVYLAEDLKHDRKVAIKVLKPELAALLGAERFVVEIKTTAALSHPHILPLFDSGIADGFLFYVMPYVEGDSLRARLNRDRQLPVAEAIRIGAEISSALDFAHRHGVIHRDIKPDNILLHDGLATLADFGIARALSVAGGSRLTETGQSVGTPAYMSPEQATGDNNVDGRTDIYSLGCVVYEMLVGEPPFTGPTAQAIIARILTESPRPVHATRSSVTATIDNVISKSLSRSPSDRFATAGEFTSALTAAAADPAMVTPAVRRRNPWLVPSALLGAALVVGALVVTLDQPGEQSVPALEPPRVAVLPLENLGGDEDAPFVTGMTEEIMTRLAGVSGMRVVSRQSARRFANRTIAAKEASRALGADYLLEGTVRVARAAGQPAEARVSVTLVRGDDEASVWGESYAASLDPTEVFGVQERIALAVANAMNVTLGTRDRANVAKAGTRDTAAYRLYQLGRFNWEKRDRDGLTRAREHFAQAIARDPSYARAHSGLADAIGVYLTIFAADSGPGAGDEGIAAARRAIELDNTMAEGYASLGYMLLTAGFQPREAEEALRTSIRLDPAYGPARYWLAQLLNSAGDRAGALEQARKAVQVDPLAVLPYAVYARVLITADSLGAAEAAGVRAAELQSNYVTSWSTQGVARVLLGDRTGAKAAFREFFRAYLPPEHTSQQVEQLASLASDLRTRRNAAAELVRVGRTAGVPSNLAIEAWWFGIAGEVDSVLARVRQSQATRNTLILLALGDLDLYLRSDPRWTPLLRELGFTPR